jgi:hypothetical protein
MPPFGTWCNEDGYLKPTSEGAWLLTDGTFLAGEADQLPGEGAIWKGYYQAAEYILKLYTTGEYGLEKIAYQLN